MTSQRIHVALEHMARLESALAASARAARQRVAVQSEAATLLMEVSQLAAVHRSALLERLAAIGGAPGQTRGALPEVEPSDPLGLGATHPTATALGTVYAAVQQAIVAYATLQPLSHRLQDSWVVAPAGTAAHLAREHTQQYLQVAGQLLAALPDAIVGELDAEGTPCQCTCPACSFGLCLCAATALTITDQAWLAARPSVQDTGVSIPLPRHTTPAAAAGLEAGDTIVAIDGTKIDSTTAVQRAIRDRQPGDRLHLKVKRDGRELMRQATLPRTFEVDADDDCLQPAGQSFALEAAGATHGRVGARVDGAQDRHVAALARLSARELQVLGLVADGADNPRIADQLEIARPTVARHISNILEKLDVSNRAQAASLAAANGLLAQR